GAGGKVPLTVEIHPGRDLSSPTGQVFNSGGASDFVVHDATGGKSGRAVFLFDTEEGEISGWSPGVDGTHSLLGLDNSSKGAIYKGLAIGSNGGSSVLFAANFGGIGAIERYDGGFNSLGNITDPSLPANYNPFNVQVLGTHLYVTYAQTSGGVDEVDG